MKNPTAETLEACVRLRADGLGWKDILAQTGLSHSQAEIAVLKATLPADAFVPFSPEAVVALRSEGISWGEIGVRLGVPEGKVRSAFKAATGTLSEGLRIGSGGRFLNADAVLYADVLKQSGTAIPNEYGRINARKAAVECRMMKLDRSELKALAADYGITVAKNATPASIINKIKKAMSV